jgi:hypothetical protein
MAIRQAAARASVAMIPCPDHDLKSDSRLHGFEILVPQNEIMGVSGCP